MSSARIGDAVGRKVSSDASVIGGGVVVGDHVLPSGDGVLSAESIAFSSSTVANELGDEVAVGDQVLPLGDGVLPSDSSTSPSPPASASSSLLFILQLTSAKHFSPPPHSECEPVTHGR